MSKVSPKKLSARHIERTLWISLTAVLLLTIIFLLVFSFPSVFQHKYNYVSPAVREDKPSDYAYRLGRIYHLILANYVNPVNPADLYRAAIKGMLDILDDPYAQLMEKSSALDIRDTITGEFGGVGLVISKKKLSESDKTDSDDFALYVVSPLEGTPAYQAGIRTGDYINKIDGKPTQDFSIEESMTLLRGRPGTSVTLTIQRGQTEFDVTIKRAKIEIETAKYDLLDGYGYLRMIEFTNRLPLRVHEALTYFKEQNIKGLIIDLRGNPGGSLDAALEVADFFLNKEDVIVSTSSDSRKEEITYVAKNNTLVDPALPIVVLIDKGSASASEILAGALKAHHRAVIVGQTSYGKAQVQQIFPLKQDSSELFKLTVAQYFTPDGQNIDKEGIIPEVIIDMEILNDENTAQSWKILYEGQIIEKFLDKNSEPTLTQVQTFRNEQRKNGVNLSTNDFLYLIRMERLRRLAPTHVYDLQYDPALEKALNILKKESR